VVLRLRYDGPSGGWTLAEDVMPVVYEYSKEVPLLYGSREIHNCHKRWRRPWRPCSPVEENLRSS
jgi:hypothetical protein